MFVSDVKESTKKQVQINTSAEISEMVTFNKMGQAVQWVHAIDYEALLQQIDSLKRDNQWTHEANNRQRESLENLQKFAKELWEEYQLLSIPSKVGPVYRKIFDRLTMILGLEKDWMLLANLSLTCDKSKEPPCHLEPSTELCQTCSLNKNQPKSNVMT